MTLDLRQDEGQKVLHDLVVGCDALTSNLRGDVPEKLSRFAGRVPAAPVNNIAEQLKFAFRDVVISNHLMLRHRWSKL